MASSVCTLQGELKDVKKKLRSSEDEVKKLEAENSKFLTLLKDIQAKVSASIGSSTSSADPCDATSASSSASASATVNGKSESSS